MDADLFRQFHEAQRTLAQLDLTERLGTLLASELTMPQLKVLLLLKAHGSLSMHGLAELLDVSMPTMTGTVGRLVERGLIDRREEPTDRRVRLVSLTTEGEAGVEELESAQWEMARELLGELDSRTLRGFVEGFTAIAAAAQRRYGPERGDVVAP